MRFRIHFSTCVVLSAVATLFFLLNVPGQIKVGPYIRESGKYGPHWSNLHDHCEHGFPLTYAVRHEIEVKNPPYVRLSLWKLSEGIEDFDLLALFVDLAIAVAIVVICAGVVESRRRKKPRFQFSLGTALLTMTLFAGAIGAYALYRNDYLYEQRLLGAIQQSRDKPQWGYDLTSDVERTYGGPTWLRQFVGDRFFGVFDRVAAVDTDGPELQHIVKLRHLTIVRIMGGATNSQLKLLEQLPNLQAIDLCFGAAIDERELADPDFDAGVIYFELPRLSKLRGINLYETSFRGDGLENLPMLEVLYAPGTEIDDEALAMLGKHANLLYLSLYSTKVSDDGIAHLRSHSQLESLALGGNNISDRGVNHLQPLTQLQWLSLDGCDVSDASIPILIGLKKLDYLDVGDTKISRMGFEQLQKALPNCDINY